MDAKSGDEYEQITRVLGNIEYILKRERLGAFIHVMGKGKGKSKLVLPECANIEYDRTGFDGQIKFRLKSPDQAGYGNISVTDFFLSSTRKAMVMFQELVRMLTTAFQAGNIDKRQIPLYDAADEIEDE